MTTMTNARFAEHVLRLAQSAPAFRPAVTYDPDGDCIEFIVAPDAFYAERVDDLVTVYYSQENRKIIGSLIKGVSKFCRQMSERMAGFKIEIEDGPVRLEHLFLAKLWALNPQAKGTMAVASYRKIYRELINMAEQNEATVELAGV